MVKRKYWFFTLVISTRHPNNSEYCRCLVPEIKESSHKIPFKVKSYEIEKAEILI